MLFFPAISMVENISYHPGANVILNDKFYKWIHHVQYMVLD